jgi:hypothetical protein
MAVSRNAVMRRTSCDYLGDLALQCIEHRGVRQTLFHAVGGLRLITPYP